jgi:hypothetical protein
MVMFLCTGEEIDGLLGSRMQTRREVLLPHHWVNRLLGMNRSVRSYRR